MTDAIRTNSAPQEAAAAPRKDRSHNEDALRQTAREFEAAFISEMLKHAGLAKAMTGAAGGPGDGFSALLLEQYSLRIVEKGGFGLADKLYARLKEQN